MQFQSGQLWETQGRNRDMEMSVASVKKIECREALARFCRLYALCTLAPLGIRVHG